MYQAPMAVWNDIAKSQPLGKPWAMLFRASAQELPAMLDKLVDKPLEQAGADNKTVLAYRLVAPLLMENEAISAYLVETQQSQLRASLPELISLNEALILASMEYRLMPSQQDKLKQLLQQAMKKSSLNRASEQPTKQPPKAQA